MPRPKRTHRTLKSRKSVLALFSENADGHANGIELFAVGTHRGKEYTDGDLDQMVDNFNRLSTGKDPVLQPPLVLGHEEDQQFLENSGWPAAGWIKKLYTKENTCPECGGKKQRNTEDGSGPAECPKCHGTGKLKFLMGDAGEIPKPIAKLINSRAYRKGSAEIYDDFEHNGQHFGKTLRRFALLGGELPQVKDLRDLPRVGYSESPRQPTFTVFSEVRPMDREAMTKALLEDGCDQSVLDGMSDEQLAEMLRVYGQDDMDEGPPDDASDEDKKRMGEEYAEKAKRYKEFAAKCGMKMDDTPTDTPPMAEPAAGAPVAKVPNPAPESMSVPPPPAPHPAPAVPAIPPEDGRLPKKVMMQYSEQLKAMDDQLKAGKERLDRLDALAAKREQEEKRATVQTFCERMVKAGKLIPADLDKRPDGSPNKLDWLLTQDAAPVHKFGEKTLSQLDIAMQAIESGPSILKYGERLKDPSKKRAAGDAEVQKVERFAENDQAFQHVLSIQGKTPEDHVNEFKEALKKNPKLTAKSYGVPEPYLVA